MKLKDLVKQVSSFVRTSTELKKTSAEILSTFRGSLLLLVGTDVV